MASILRSREIRNRRRHRFHRPPEIPFLNVLLQIQFRVSLCHGYTKTIAIPVERDEIVSRGLLATFLSVHLLVRSRNLSFR